MKIHGFVARGAIALAIAAVAVPAQAQTAESDRTWPSRTSPGEVTLEATPTWSGTALVITLVANTHSVDLGSVDLTRSARLFVGDTEHAPADAGSLEGHHARARLVFELPEPPASFRLEIRDVPDVPLRVLAWPAADQGRL